jgi:hypothetical protein
LASRAQANVGLRFTGYGGFALRLYPPASTRLGACRSLLGDGGGRLATRLDADIVPLRRKRLIGGEDARPKVRLRIPDVGVEHESHN